MLKSDWRNPFFFAFVEKQENRPHAWYITKGWRDAA